MTVAVGSGEAPVVHEGVSYHFCCAGCRSRFEAEPSRYVTATDDARTLSYLSSRDMRRSFSTRPPVWQGAQ